MYQFLWEFFNLGFIISWYTNNQYNYNIKTKQLSWYTKNQYNYNIIKNKTNWKNKIKHKFTLNVKFSFEWNTIYCKECSLHSKTLITDTCLTDSCVRISSLAWTTKDIRETNSNISWLIYQIYFDTIKISN